MFEVYQLLAGRDFGLDNSFARQMANCIYLLVETSSNHAVLIDPAWDIESLLKVVDTSGYQLVGAIATHGHWDHIGGCFQGHIVEGVAQLVQERPVPVYVQENEITRMMASVVIENNFLRPVRDGELVKIGAEELQFIHTPGHTPGCQCVRVGKALFTGDTLFVGECGRVDLPGSDPNQMMASLKKLASLESDVMVYPGHNYGTTLTSTIERERRENPCLASWR